MNFSKPVIAAVALAAALSLTACGSSDNGAAKTTTTSAATSAATTSAEPTSTTPPVPSVEELNTKLQTALDPAVPAEDKVNLVQGLEEDPSLLAQLSEKVAAAQADGTVSNIQVVGPLTPINAEQMSVPFTMELSGQVQPSAVDVVVDGGEWKLAKSSICALAGLLEITSPVCAA